MPGTHARDQSRDHSKRDHEVKEFDDGEPSYIHTNTYPTQHPTKNGIPKAHPNEGEMVFDEMVLSDFSRIIASFTEHTKVIFNNAASMNPVAGLFHDGYQVNNIVLELVKTHKTNGKLVDQIIGDLEDGIAMVIASCKETEADAISDIKNLQATIGQVSLKSYSNQTEGTP